MGSFFDGISIRTLAHLITATAVKDQTTPGSKNGWETDVAFRLVERLVVGKCSDPEAFVDIAQRVLVLVQDFPEARALALLNKFNGMRRLPASPSLERVSVQATEELARVIAELPDSDKKTRLLELLLYNVATFSAAYGRYDVAAGMYVRSAHEAHRINNAPGVAIANYCEIGCRLRHALCQGNKEDENYYFARLTESFAQMVEATRGTPLQLPWAESNGPAHMLMACIWLGKYPPIWDSLVKTLIATAKIGKSHEPDGMFAQAVDMDVMGNPEAETALLAISGDSTNPEMQATVFLMLAREAENEKQNDLAREFVSRMQKEGILHIRAVAQRLLGGKTE